MTLLLPAQLLSLINLHLAQPAIGTDSSSKFEFKIPVRCSGNENPAK
jgi:hypothetical protein